MAGFCPVDREPCCEDCPEGHCEHAAARLRVENQARDHQATYNTPEAVEQWLWLPHEHLGWQLPRDAIREGRGVEVIELIQASLGGR
jgi:hypothetical protein